MMGVHGASPVLAPPPMSPEHIAHRRRSLSRSDSFTSCDFGHTGKAMAIPGTHRHFVPPPLPPPRHLPELSVGHDVAWQLENDQRGDRSQQLPSIKPGSSLFGGFCRPKTPQSHGRRMDLDVDPRPEATSRGPSRPDAVAVSNTMAGAGRPPSPTRPSNHGFHGLSQDTTARPKRDNYDSQMLKKIGKSNSPPRHAAPDLDSPILSKELSLQTAELKTGRSSQNEPTSAADSVGRLITSPTSVDHSPFSRTDWPEGRPGSRSPPEEAAACPMALDPELFGHSLPALRRPMGQSTSVDENNGSRSGRNSYDQNMCTPVSEATDDGASVLKSFNSDDHAVDRHQSRPGMKRKSPPCESHADDRSREIYPRLVTRLAPRSPGTSYNAHHHSSSSAASSAQQSSYASSGLYSAAPSSMTSVSSYDNQSPRDYSHGATYAATAASIASPLSAASSRKDADRIAPRKMPAHPGAPEIRPAPARIGNHYICACCPKKPKKFETEEQLRTHENEKQYACAYCHNRFKNKNEAERHQNSLHLRKHSWSCAALVNFKAAFSPAGAVDSASTAHDACGYCGEEFSNLPAPDWESRLEHLTNTHKYGECNSAKKFFRADHFRQHLKHSHGGKSGKWTNILEHACVRDEMAPETGSTSYPTGDALPYAALRPHVTGLQHD